MKTKKTVTPFNMQEIARALRELMRLYSVKSLFFIILLF